MNDTDALRRWVVGLIVVTAVALACGRIVSTQLVLEPSLHRNADEPGTARVWPMKRPRPMPTFSSNDRSRWATVRSLVDEGTYVVGRRDLSRTYASALAPVGQLDPLAVVALAHAGLQVRSASDSGIIFEDGWQSVDKVLQPTTQEFYSSKPPLLSTLVAGLYWLLQQVTAVVFALLQPLLGDSYVPSRWTLADHPAEVVRTLLLFINALPFGIYLVLLARTAATWARTDAGGLYVVAAGAFATLVTPFLITFNNHTVATFSVMASWYCLLRIWRPLPSPPLRGRGNGSEGDRMPWEAATSFPATRPAWYYFAAAGFFSAFAACNELPALAFAAAVFALVLWYHPRPALLWFVPAAALPAGAFFATNYVAVGQWRPAYSEFGSPWYEYEGSHWRKAKLAEGRPTPGIDFAHTQETRAAYAFHVLFGHHGLFSLAPIWLLSVAAMVMGVARFRSLWREARAPPPVANATGAPVELPWFVQPLGLLLTVVVAGFYLVESNNYGGWTNGPRWLMWLTPIWLTCMLPLADRLPCCRTGRLIAFVLLGVSIFSVHYQLWNPWRHPWLYDFMTELGWPGY
jgi:hypothetical protein